LGFRFGVRQAAATVDSNSICWQFSRRKAERVRGAHRLLRFSPRPVLVGAKNCGEREREAGVAKTGKQTIQYIFKKWIGRAGR